MLCSLPIPSVDAALKQKCHVQGARLLITRRVHLGQVGLTIVFFQGNQATLMCC
jgi:hypothetical protein